LLVFSEQGFGDTIQFARYLPLLSTRRCRITFLTYPELVSLLPSQFAKPGRLLRSETDASNRHS
jgi:hypothetical protein